MQPTTVLSLQQIVKETKHTVTIQQDWTGDFSNGDIKMFRRTSTSPKNVIKQHEIGTTIVHKPSECVLYNQDWNTLKEEWI